MVLLIPGSILVGAWWGGVGTFFTLFFVFVLTPILDLILGLDTDNSVPEPSARNLRYDLLLWLFVPLELFLLGFGLVEVSSGRRSGLEILGLTLSVGVVTGALGITIAHELMHRPGRWERALAELLMTASTYPHFCVEHVLGHHKHVATPHDPATARQGENVYGFVLRSVLGGVVSAWRLEGERVRRLNLRPFGLRDRRLRHPLLVLFTHTLVYGLFGLPGLFFMALQSLVAVFLLESINYVEHYGLKRRELEPGRYERVQPRHSWNSSHRMSSWYLFNLPRHADHHFLASRPYFCLRHLEDSPQLPAGYGTMVLVAWAPPLWRRLMDPRVQALESHLA